MRLVSAISVSLLCVVYSAELAFPSPPEAAQETKPSAVTVRQVLNRMATAYKECKSYCDSGVVKTEFFTKKEGRSHGEEKPFKTAFIRPDRFRFEYSAHAGPANMGPIRRYIVWRNAEQVKSYWDVQPKREGQKSLGLALAGATGVSGGSAHTIPALLMPDEVGGRKLTDMTEIERLEDAKLGDVNCFQIQGKFGGRDEVVWIDQSSFLVRRIDSKDTLGGDLRVETTTTYEPEVNKDIPEGMLDFSAPKPK